MPLAALISPLNRRFVKILLTAAMAVSFFAVSAPWAQAASLTEAQIQAIMGLLSSFGADSATISNTYAALRGTGAPSSVLLPAPAEATTTQAVEKLSLAVDTSSPAFAVVPAGATGVTMGVIKLRAYGGSISVSSVTLRLASGNIGDLLQTQLYSGTTLIGRAVFGGTSLSAVSTLTTPLSLSPDSDTKIIIKADFSRIGNTEQGTAGNLVQINPVSAEGKSFARGTTLSATASGATAGVRLLRTYPSVSRPALPESGLSDGRLLRFSITANTAGDVVIGALSFNVTASGVSVTSPGLFAYTDTAFSTATREWSSSVTANGNRYTASFPAPFVIPAGQTRFFELRATVTGTATGASVVSTLLGDASFSGIAAFTAQKEKYNFVWSDNAASASFSGNGWMNGSGVLGLSLTGVTQVRTGTGAQALSATIDKSSLSSTSGSPTLTGTLTGTSSAAIVISAGDRASGTGTITAVNGRWSATIAPPLPVGTYKVSILSGTAVLAAGELSILSAATTTSANPGASAGGFGEMMAAAAAAPFNLLVEALTDLFIYAGIGQ